MTYNVDQHIIFRYQIYKAESAVQLNIKMYLFVACIYSV